MLKVSKIKIFVISVLILFPAVTCRKDSFKFPTVNINASLGIDSDLGDLGVGSVKIYPPNKFGDVGGLIIYRDFDENYYVFDAACTHDYLDGCYVKKDKFDTFILECPCCKSVFQLSADGNDVSKGPAKYPLVQYHAFVNGGFLVVSN